MSSKPTISAIVLSSNEEKFLPGCLKSVKWADEILIVDAGSTDKTIEIAEKAGARVINNPWQGFSKQRNVGAKEAKGDWLLYVDADERVSKGLREEIKELLSSDNIPHNSYKIPHKNYILGKWLRFGGWYPEHQHRLIKKGEFSVWKGELHEHPKVNGTVGKLKGNLIHLTHRGMKWMLEKTIRYAKIEADLRLEAGHPKVKVIHFFSAPAREFWYRCIKKQGWRDEIIGWIEIFYQAFNQFLIMAWLWEMQNEKNMQKKYKELDKQITDEL